MSQPMTREEAKAWKARWELVNEREIEELRRTPPMVRMQQLAALMAAAEEMGWKESLEEGVEEVRRRWQRLRAAYAAKAKQQADAAPSPQAGG